MLSALAIIFPLLYILQESRQELDNNNNGDDIKNGTNNATAKNDDNNGNNDHEYVLTESFLDSGAFPNHDVIDHNKMLNSNYNGNGILNKGGVLGLVKEYYKKSDVGR